MSNKSKTTKAQDLLNTQNYTENGNGNKPPSSNEGNIETNDDNSSKFINYTVDNTPFRVIGNERDGFILIMGKHRLCSPKNTPKDAEAMLDTDAWNVVFNMVAAMIELNENMRSSTLADFEITT